MRHAGAADPFAPLTEAEVARNDVPESAQAAKVVPVLPVPQGTPDPDFVHPGYGAPSAHWAYRDEEGRLLGYAVRFDPPKSKKKVLPLTWCCHPDGSHSWEWKSLPQPRPPYGRDWLAARPDVPVLVAEGEKSADGAQAVFSDHVAITSPGGCRAAERCDWTAVQGRHLVIWPDADDEGMAYADDVARLARDAGAASVRIVEVPDGYPEGWDLADEPPDGVTGTELRHLLNEARPVGSDLPLPLFPPLPAAECYPIDALGPVLAAAAAAISRKVQAPEAIAGQAVLAATSLAVQAHADVMLPYGQSRPLSLFLVTVAGSGDRKSTADNEALWPMRKREAALREQHDRELQEWGIDHAAWAAEKRKIEADKKRGYEERKAALAELGPEPQRPLHPFLTITDPTFEGLTKAWVHAHAALGIFSAEGGQFVGGHGMAQENRLRTAAGYSELWDGQPIKRMRAGDGVNILVGRRLAMHLMVQPDAAARFLSDTLLRDQGLLSRILVAAPDSIAGTRLYRSPTAEDDAAIKTYGARLLAMSEASWPLAEGRQNELTPRALAFDTEAEAAWCAFHDHVERQCGPGQDLAPIRDFAAKAAEHAARIAGVLTLVGDLRAEQIGMAAMELGLILADWYVNETLRLQQAARTDPRLLLAQQLLEWLHGRTSDVVEHRDIMRLGPKPVRLKAAADDAVAILVEHHWVLELPGRPRRIRVVRRSGAAA